MRQPTGHSVLEELDRAECLRLIAGVSVGRVGFDDGQGPAVTPVNFALDGDTVVFSTTLSGRLSRSLDTLFTDADVRIAFEVDRIDERSHTGWSVLLRGGARRMPEGEPVPVEPWPDGEREAHIRLTPTEVTGRRLRSP
ncbi:pyridoxamine 5'-phosphate oxidase family protein [Actinomadura kijaniata]|uniref:pyridoxamine 5'-phosphate oxidase family protein n=1 Tax=Actinomadura kijaniata TaxID=46161 RepID=UPI003F1993D6